MMTWVHPFKGGKACLLLMLLGLFAACRNETKTSAGGSASEVDAEPAVINYGVVKTLPHDTTAFTEGLQVYNGQLYESTGSPQDLPQARSVVGVVDLETGKLIPKVEIDREKYFGEGIVFLNGKVYQLTYQSKVGFVYDAGTFQKVGEFSFASKEGWGLTTEGKHLIMSDGTNVLSYLDPVTFKKVKELKVYDHNGPVANINELEFINGFLYANIYTTNYIVKINPQNGEVVGRLDLTSLAQDALRKNRNSLELNGIAYDSTAGHVLVTGKLWPTMYAIKFNY
ncbi:glutaminyl-peptide cyclotransferase [Sabulibacter ruber]|uniref:glutaminyl-peptide cyclotransferase n=1 Tax=Sabulibacter ruber TaxID=2811901 RepID=UPI001A9706F3|nr:glutaminyl-peptide cyclotransferase [Sabulibacter ruber]